MEELAQSSSGRTKRWPTPTRPGGEYFPRLVGWRGPGHLDTIRRDPDTWVPGGLVHLVLEVIAYADDAQSMGRRGAGGRPGMCASR